METNVETEPTLEDLAALLDGMSRVETQGDEKERLEKLLACNGEGCTRPLLIEVD